MHDWLDDPNDVTWAEFKMDTDEEFIELPYDCGHLPMEGCDCYLDDMYWSGTGESMGDDSYIDYLNSYR